MTKAAPIASINTNSQVLFPKNLIPKILFEDTHLIVLSKPPGLLSQGDISGDPNLVDWLRGYLGRPYVGLVHRLDRNTSGVMIVAKRTKSAQRLTDALQRGDLFRAYLAWIVGTLPEPKKWVHYLKKNAEANTSQVVADNYSGKLATLTVRPVRQHAWQSQPITLVEFILETGRSHQIRVQSAHEGFPLLGDTKYGGHRSNPMNFTRVALHSHHLKFFHPMSKDPMEFCDPLPPDLMF